MVQEGRNILEQSPGYQMLGCNFIMSDKTIVDLCTLAASVTSVADLNEVVTLRAEIRKRIFVYSDVFYNVAMSV